MDGTGGLGQIEKSLGEADLEAQKLDTHREIWLSLLKALPTVLIVSTIAVVTSFIYATDDSEFSGIAIGVSLTTFVCTLCLWMFSLAAVSRSDKEVVSKQTEINELRREKERLRATAIDMFQRYKGWMPNEFIRLKSGILSLQDGTLDTAKIIDWRKNIGEARQNDMEHLDGVLVEDMDNLLKSSKTFVEAFNEFAPLAYEVAKGTTCPEVPEGERPEVVRSVVFSIYRYNVEVEDGTPSKQEFNRILMEEVRPYQCELVKGKKIVVRDLSNALGKPDIRLKSSNAESKHKSLIQIHETVMKKIRYWYSAET